MGGATCQSGVSEAEVALAHASAWPPKDMLGSNVETKIATIVLKNAYLLPGGPVWKLTVARSRNAVMSTNASSITAAGCVAWMTLTSFASASSSTSAATARPTSAAPYNSVVGFSSARQ
eukprot:1542540-Amphidinium_carterae.1